VAIVWPYYEAAFTMRTYARACDDDIEGTGWVSGHCPGRMDISPRSACVYRYVIPDMLLQTPAAQELLPGGELSEQFW
jgi:hypothetical protein